MLNPLVDSLDSFTIVELEDKVLELQRKYFMTHNPSVQAQIANILEIYQQEVRSRRAIEAQRQREQQDGDNSLDNLIKVS
jgi:hypothetical protein